MGKLRFTLTYVLFWFVIIASCFLAENFNFFSADPLSGMRPESLVTLSLLIICMLIFYYFRERDKNGVTIDKVLLPIIAIFGLVSIATVWWQGERSFADPSGSNIANV